MKRRRLLAEDVAGMTQDNLADICLYDKREHRRIFVSPDELENFADTDTYTPIGVVVIPSSHDVYGTGKCAVMSALSMSLSNPTAGANTEQKMVWYSSMVSAGLTNYSVINTVTNATDNILDGTAAQAYLPSTNTNGNFTTMSADGVSKYYKGTYAPSPYLADGSRNPNYHSNEKSKFNALSDFEGPENTSHLISKWREVAEAAYTCSQFKTDGTEQGDWYLPACGELGYMVSRFEEIQSALTAIRTVYGTSYASLLDTNNIYWSSSENSQSAARSLNTGNGSVTAYNKSITYYVRAFLRVAYNKIQNLTGSHNGYEYVDLGLPSGLLWATCNIGASKPEEYGNYYTYGGSTNKNRLDRYYGGDLPIYSDTARNKMGGSWRMPTRDQFIELIDNCEKSWTKQNNIQGYLLTSKINSNTIFFPASGNYFTSMNNVGSIGYYWSRNGAITDEDSYTIYSYYLYCTPDSLRVSSQYSTPSGCNCYSVRAVLSRADI